MGIRSLTKTCTMNSQSFMSQYSLLHLLHEQDGLAFIWGTGTKGRLGFGNEVVGG